MQLNEIATIKRACGDCVHCRVHGANELGDGLCHCEFDLWRDRCGRPVLVKTTVGAEHTRMVCDRFDEA